jgi:hypothetical protein
MRDHLHLEYAIDQAAALREGRAINQRTAIIPVTDETLAQLTGDERAFMATHLSAGDQTATVHFEGKIKFDSFIREDFPKAKRILDPGDVPEFVRECYRAACELRAKITADHEAKKRVEAQTEQTVIRETSMIAAALAVDPGLIMGAAPVGLLTGNEHYEYAAENAIKTYLAERSEYLASAWGRQSSKFRGVIDDVADRIKAFREKRKAARMEWVRELVSEFGTQNDRERHDAGVMPRRDIEALVWDAVEAPTGNIEFTACPECGDEFSEASYVTDKKVSAEVWSAAQEISSAFDAKQLEALGLAITRDIVFVEYDCHACEPSSRFELRVVLEHPENGWQSQPRYYQLQ